MNNPYIELRNAIVLRATQDIKEFFAIQEGRRYCRDRERAEIRHNFYDAVEFLKSDWLDVLIGQEVDREIILEEVMKRCRENAKM